MYDKGNYAKMKDELDKIDWDELFDGHQDNANAQWKLFKNIYSELEKDCVPRKKVFINGKISLRKTPLPPRPNQP